MLHQPLLLNLKEYIHILICQNENRKHIQNAEYGRKLNFLIWLERITQKDFMSNYNDKPIFQDHKRHWLG